MTRNEESLQALFSGKELIKSDYDLNDGYDTNFNFMKIDQFTLLDEFKKIGYRLMDYWRSDEDLFFSVIHDNTETPFCYNEGTGDLFAGSKYLCIDNVSGEKELVDTVKWYEEGGWKTIESSRRPIKSANYTPSRPYNRGAGYDFVVDALLDIAEWGEKEKGKDSTIEDGHDGVIFRGELFHEYYDFYEGSSYSGKDAFYDMIDDYNEANPNRKYNKNYFTVIDTNEPQVEIKLNRRLYNSLRPIKSATGTIHCVYLSDITPTEWTKDMALAAIKNSVTNYGYYEYNGKKGLCIVGDFEDIHNFIESVGHVVDEDNLYHWKEFPWDNAKKLDTVKSSRRPIKSSYNIVGVNVDSNGNLYYKFWNEDKRTFDRDSVNCTKYEDKDTAQYELQHHIPSKYDSVFDYFEVHDFNEPYKLQSSRRPIKSSNNDLFNQIKKYIEDETVGKGRVETEGNIIHYRTLIVTVDDYGYSMQDTWSDFYDKGDNIEDFKNDYWEWVNPF